MSIPDVNVNIIDPGLGIVSASAGKTQVKLGCCTAGTPATVYGVGSKSAATLSLGSGPVVEAAIKALASGPVYVVPVTPGTLGSMASSLTLTGSGSGTVSGNEGPQKVIRVKIHTGGTMETMKFQVSVDGGAYGAAVTSGVAPMTYQVPGAMFTKLVFTAGTYVTADVFTIATNGVVSRAGSGTATLLDTSAHSPIDNYTVQVQIVTAGALGTAAFKYSLDGGNNWSGAVLTPVAGVYVIPESGVVLTFVGTFTLDDLYEGAATAPVHSDADVTTAITALLADSIDWGFLHVVGSRTTAALTEDLATAVGAALDTAEGEYRYAFGIVEGDWASSGGTKDDAGYRTAFAAFADPRVCVCVGDVDLVSLLTGRTQVRNLAWAVSARLGGIKLSRDPSAVADGALSGVSAIYRDERATPGLDEARFVTVRTYIGKPGYYVTNCPTMAADGSDFKYVMNRRVMDRACQIARAGYLNYLNEDVRVDTTTGYIDERDAQKVDGQVGAQLRAALLNEQEVSGVTALLSRTDDLLTTSHAHADVSIVPKAYLKQITVEIGFENPAAQ